MIYNNCFNWLSPWCIPGLKFINLNLKKYSKFYLSKIEILDKILLSNIIFLKYPRLKSTYPYTLLVIKSELIGIKLSNL